MQFMGAAEPDSQRKISGRQMRGLHRAMAVTQRYDDPEPCTSLSKSWVQSDVWEVEEFTGELEPEVD